MCAHQLIPAVPVDRAVDGGVHRREPVSFNLVDDPAVRPRELLDGVFVGRRAEESRIGGLAATAGVEGRPVEHDPLLGRRGHGAVELPQVGVLVAQQGRHDGLLVSAGMWSYLNRKSGVEDTTIGLEGVSEVPFPLSARQGRGGIGNHLWKHPLGSNLYKAQKRTG